jgi:amino acid adenylation domain-containing protein
MDVVATQTAGPFWKAIFADLPSAGQLRGSAQVPPERPALLNGELEIPLSVTHVLPRGATLEAALHATWATVLSRHTSSLDVIYFTSFGDAESWIAPTRVAIPPKMPAVEWLAAMAGQVARHLEVGPLPGVFLNQARDEAIDRTTPTFIIVPRDAVSFPPREDIRGPLLVLARLDVSLLEIHFDTAWFEVEEVRALGEHFNVVWEALVTAPETPVGKLPILTAAERITVLDTWNDTKVPFAETTCVHQFFEEQARLTPDAVAVVFTDRQWTYRELDQEADRVAQRLRVAGVTRGTFVAICLNRSLDLMATLFGVLKAGGAFIPLDPSYPAERLAFMIEDAKPAVIVVSRQTRDSFPDATAPLFLVDEEDGAPVIPGPVTTHSESSDAAYVLYTSGSTGKPKGVVVTHRNVSNFFTAMDGVIGTEVGVWLAVTSVNFDISVFELFWTLARGFRIILQEEGQWVSATDSMYSLPQQIRRHGVTHLQCTPSLASMLICDSESVAAIKPLKRFMVGGEPLPLDLARRLCNIISGDLYNLYGPTETTVWSAAQKVSAAEKQILIGRPVANNTLYVLDSERELVPIGSVGELYIGGDGLAREYLHRPDVTAERFITHTFAPGRTERLYRTGDLVRHMRDGRLEFIGRIDAQIKIRGVRIELGEIEVALREHPDIRDAVVLVVDDGTEDKRLVGYVIPHSPAAVPQVGTLTQWLGTKLPKMLVPSALVFLPEFPKTPNGKLDRRALPQPALKTAPGVSAPTDLDGQIAAIWAEALGLEHVGLDERFFDIGGHSLLMVEVHDKLREKAGYTVPLLDLFQFPTVRALAQHLKAKAGTANKKPKTATLIREKLREQFAARQNLLRKPAPARRKP